MPCCFGDGLSQVPRIESAGRALLWRTPTHVFHIRFLRGIRGLDTLSTGIRMDFRLEPRPPIREGQKRNLLFGSHSNRHRRGSHGSKLALSTRTRP